MASTSESLTLEVATPTGWAVEKLEVQSVRAPSVFGEFGVLPGHLPLLVALKAGPLHYTVDGTVHHAAMGGTGYAQVERGGDGPDVVRILSEFFVRPEDVDVDAAQADLDNAVRAQKEAGANSADRETFARDEAWARARLDIAELAGH